MATALGDPALGSTQAANDEVEAADYSDDAEEEEAVAVGTMEVNVVGLKYYHGTVTDGEMVTLQREPSNPYDSNAIRVLNIRGEQVGHVERGKAAGLAPLVDSQMAILEGVVPRGSRSAYKMPCDVWIFSLPNMCDAVLNHFQLTGQRIRRPGEEEGHEERGGRGSRARGAGASSRGRSGKRTAAAASASSRSSIDDMFESLGLNAVKRQSIEADPVITSELLQHQKEALAWMVQRENLSRLPPFWEVQPPKGNKGTMYMNTLTNFATDKRPDALRGGIFADDMGLGKTLAILALIATNRPGANLPAIVDISDDSVLEEEEEEERPSKKRKQSSGKSKDKDKGKAAAAAADNCSSLVPAANGPRATLVVCPVSVLSNWVGQIEEHTAPGALKIELYHGPDRVRNVKKLSSCDVVLTSFNTLGTEFNDRNCPLKKVKWLRVVLDEAHLVKNPKALQTKCAVVLQAERRWAVTGTPIQNGVKDLFSLMQFLHVEPLNDAPFWNRTIQRPLNNGEESGFARVQGLMAAISLRRTKRTKINGRSLVQLPPKLVTVHRVELNPDDRILYDKMEKDGKEIIRKLIASNSLMKKYTTVVLQLILRLRQICDHSTLCPGSMDLLKAAAEANELAVADPELLQKMLALVGDDFDCPICLSPPTIAIITKCAHVFCRRCIEKTFTCDKRQCPMCRANLTESDIYTSNAPDEAEQDDTVAEGALKNSAKVDALLRLLQNSRDKDPSVKSVVFSQFAQMLKVLEKPLTDAGFKFVKLQGGMSVKKREEAMKAFKSTSSGSPTVFLLSLKAAGVGLNLVTASNVFMMDPWWNPACEEQAMDRVHRLGQTRDVHVFRLVASDTIEERMLKMQEKKLAYAQIACGKEANDQRKQRCTEEVKLLINFS